MTLPIRRTERPVAMSTSNFAASLGGLRLAALSLVIAATASGCARDATQTGALPDDYRTRHPVVVGETEKAIDLPIAVGERRLTTPTREVVRGFGQKYASASTGVVQIMLPSGSPNAAAANGVRPEIRRALVEGGVPANRILETHYQADSSGDAAPVRLSFTAIAASTAPCGNWPADLAKNTIDNKNYENFGCATQSNLAAQIANPTDLLGPRAETPIDAFQRGKVIDDYRGVKSGTTITIGTN